MLPNSRGIKAAASLRLFIIGIPGLPWPFRPGATVQKLVKLMRMGGGSGACVYHDGVRVNWALELKLDTC